MRFAYADPPYPGLSEMFYGKHPDYAGEVDHKQLIRQLEDGYPDGWALSTSSSALPYVLSLCHVPVRIAVWHKTNAAPIGNLRGKYAWHRSWEPVIVSGGRKEQAPVKDVLTCGAGGREGRFPGAKPPAFSMWMFQLLGAQPEDELDDLFPGSGAVARAWEEFRSTPPQPVLPFPDLSGVSPMRAMLAMGVPMLDGTLPPRTWKPQGRYRTR